MMNWTHSITYEQPVNEHIRMCLRLEHLFNLIDHFMPDEASIWQTREALDAILEVINILDRPDLKNVFSKELLRCHAIFSRLRQIPAVDHKKLTHILHEIEKINEGLASLNNKIGQRLRENDFLTSIRMYRLNPGGICSFDLPGFHFWLQQPAHIRLKFLKTWLDELAIIKKATNLLLQLIRESGMPENQTAHDGFFQMALDPKSACQMIRIVLPSSLQVYPELSVGRHRLAIRFYEPNLFGKSIQVKDEILFKLILCIL